MRFSQIVGSTYHHIGLTKQDQDLLDTFFTGAAHHFHRYKQSGMNITFEIFHDYFFRAHLAALMRVVFECGEFSRATDPTGLELHLRRNWNPGLSNYQMPDPDMFWEMLPDARFAIGKNHPNDIYLRRIINQSSNMQPIAVRLKGTFL